MQRQIESMMPTPKQIVEYIDKKLEEERERIVHNILSEYAKDNGLEKQKRGEIAIEGQVRDHDFIDFDSSGTSFMIPVPNHNLKCGDKVLVKILKEEMFPELKESEDERIRKELIQYLKDYPNLPNGNYCRDDFFAYLEKQCNTDKTSYEIAEKENNVNEETNAPTEYGKYVDECLKEAAKHFFSEGEDKYSVADLFYAGIRCGQSWLEKQGEKCSFDATDEELAQAKKDAFNDALDKIEYSSGEPTFDDGWCAAIKFIRQKQWKPTKEQMDTFSELAESEDERIRKEILSDYLDELHEVEVAINNTTSPDCNSSNDLELQANLKREIAWLKRQGKPQPQQEALEALRKLMHNIDASLENIQKNFHL